MSFNYVAIITASVVSVFLGTLYGIIFRKAAFLSTGKEKKKRTVSRLREYSGSIILDCFIALGLSYLIIRLGIDNLEEVLILTFWVFIGFVAPLTISALVRKNITLQNWLFNAVINAICLFVMVVILTYWR